MIETNGQRLLKEEAKLEATTPEINIQGKEKNEKSINKPKNPQWNKWNKMEQMEHI